MCTSTRGERASGCLRLAPAREPCYPQRMGNLGAWEIALIVLVILLVFGPKRLPGIGRSLGRGMREFKESVTDQTRELKEATLITPQQFKDSLNPLKDDPLKDEAQTEVEPAEAPVPVAVAETPTPESNGSTDESSAEPQR